MHFEIKVWIIKLFSVIYNMKVVNLKETQQKSDATQRTHDFKKVAYLLTYIYC